MLRVHFYLLINRRPLGGTHSSSANTGCERLIYLDNLHCEFINFNCCQEFHFREWPPFYFLFLCLVKAEIILGNGGTDMPDPLAFLVCPSEAVSGDLNPSTQQPGSPSSGMLLGVLSQGPRGVQASHLLPRGVDSCFPGCWEDTVCR